MEELIKLAESVNQQYKTIKNRISYLDLQVNNMYHKIELNKYNAVDLVKAASQLRKILRERRLEKKKFAILQSIRDTPSSKPINIEKLKCV